MPATSGVSAAVRPLLTTVAAVLVAGRLAMRALQGARLAVGALGRALAVAKDLDLDAKHAIKHVNRFFSNTALSDAELALGISVG